MEPGKSTGVVVAAEPEAAPVPTAMPAVDEVLAVLREPVVLTDAEWRIGYLNAAAQRLLGTGDSACEGRRLPELLPGGYDGDAPQPAGPWRARRARHGWIVVGADPDAEPHGWSGRMVEAEQLAAVGQIAAGVAHEIGAPLTAISVAVEYLIRGSGAGAEVGSVRRDLELILAQTQRISRLTRRLVELARPSEPEFGPTDLNLLARESLEFVERQLNRDGIVAITDFAPALPVLRADAHQLQQVMLNLLLNAHRALVRAASAEPRIELRTRCRADAVELVVADNGPGIAADDLQRIFLPFFSRAESTGMGLTVVRNIVHQHGGTVEAHSRPGEGASFHVRLPLPDHDDIG